MPEKFIREVVIPATNITMTPHLTPYNLGVLQVALVPLFHGMFPGSCGSRLLVGKPEH
jgi:hypothetical protein